MQDAVRAHVFCLCACLSLFEGQVQGLGAHPICYQRETDQRREKKFKKNKNKGMLSKTKLNTFLWNIAATGAEIT